MSSWGGTTLGVTLTLGDTQISIKTTRSARAENQSPQQTRTAALRVAKRALEVGLEELTSAEAGEA